MARRRPIRAWSATSTRRASCGICGTASIEAVHKATHFGRLDDDVSWSSRLLGALPDRLREHQQVFDRTGGVHAAGLFTPDGGCCACARTSDVTTRSTRSSAGRCATDACP
ncbi:formate dehydrogenase accessory sulfurtransferase FdhD [Aeromicrobium sp. UC242_57]|uniref:formate dehydrogenase accessory sulfurtransferase FdhD n=1 Tax=Aeromicrobium sp. UC242_57 TaxID=3374624 RepID=UPI0037B81162